MKIYVHIHTDDQGVYVSDVITSDEAQKLYQHGDVEELDAGSVLSLDGADFSSLHTLCVVEIPSSVVAMLRSAETEPAGSSA